ncbi:siderophore-interacting protein [Paenarthrobacter sp. FR1]|uniref:siderophore-interacting protein n=1 Tax=Paenarthrobacter sp. FR1 TaxID=3439548 RepID=UPI003DA6B0AD
MTALPVTSSASRKTRPQVNLTVLRKERLSPHMVRIVAGGPGFSDYANNEYVDRYVKIVFPQPGVDYEYPLDLWTIRDTMPREQWPHTRTYTIRWVDLEAQQLAIDFVVHGDEGLAGPWAAAAEPGDSMIFTGPGGAYKPAPDADWYLFAGDDAAIPAIAACVEALGANARGTAYLEVDSEADILPISAPAGVELHWLLRKGTPAGSSDLLLEALRTTEWLPGRVDVFAHGERGYMRGLREIFFAQRGLERSQVSLSGYWAQGRVEEVFQAEKKLPVGQI